ncbi:MAG: hypothetical protein AB9903_02025 [Vulcanimicrobiota bacterium]
MPVLTPKQAEEAGKKGLLRFTEEQNKALAELVIAIERKRAAREREEAKAHD